MLTHHKHKTYQWLRKRRGERKTGLLLCFLLLLLLLSVAAAAQDPKVSKTLSAGQLMQIVQLNHPVAKQASLLIEKAKAEIRIARGGFDPVFTHSLAEKTFDGTEYYRYNRPQLTIPTWWGVDLQLGLEQLNGSRTDPTETIGRTSYFGITAPLAKNLFMDKRRAALQTAKILRQASETEKRNILNDLLLDAMKSYWQWVQEYQVVRILEDAVTVNEKRFELVKTGFRLGDRPAIDTTEALTQLQNFQVLRENAWMQFQNAGLELSVFLWAPDDTPFNLPADMIPGDLPPADSLASAGLPLLADWLEAATGNHPELQLLGFRLETLRVEKKLKFQELLPALHFRYNQLGKGYNLAKTATGPLLENNFQYGITLGIPLRLSEGRGGYRQARLKITEARLGQNLKRVQIENTVRKYFNELAVLQKQLAIQEKAYRNYQALQRAEETRFSIGESSLFLINARENKSLEALQKLQELRTRYLFTLNKLQWAAGSLVN